MAVRMFDFDIIDDALELVSFNYKDDPRITRVEIPPKYKFHKVRSISPKAFSSASFLKEIVVPDSVSSIGAGAFSFCESLESVSLPPTLKIIDYNTFRLCTALRHVELPPKTAVIRSFAFSGCSSLTDVILPEMLCVIYNNAFEDCSALRSVSYPASEVTIFARAFQGCASLDTLPAMYALIGCNDLNRPFQDGVFLNWDVALRSDVFSLAVKHGSFEHIGKTELFKEIIDRNLADHMPLVEDLLDERMTEELISYAAERERPEFSARLLNARRVESTSEANDIADMINEKFSL